MANADLRSLARCRVQVLAIPQLAEQVPGLPAWERELHVCTIPTRATPAPDATSVSEFATTMPPRVATLRPLRIAISKGTRWTSSLSRFWSSDLAVLRHHHLPAESPDGLVPYDEAERLQGQLRSQFLDWKSRPELHSPAVDCPLPHLISFESTPTFTLGRRQTDLTPDQTSRLRRDLRVDLPHRCRSLQGRSFNPEVRKTNRGGLTTYHGPGQIVFWPVLDMHSPLYDKYGVASYASHLESTTQRLLAETFGIRTYANRDEPGVWVATPDGHQERKIAALGVHHRRHVTALGIALNVDIPVVGDEDVNPWARFVPCGLDGKLVTSVAAEVKSRAEEPWDLSALATRWALMFEEGLLDASRRTFDTQGKPRWL